MTSTVTILGARGSVPVSGPAFAGYGGATTCVLLRLAGQPLLLDAGTGLLHLPEHLLPKERRLPLLLSHPHADHLMGLPLCPAVFDPAFELDLYAVPRGGLDAEGQLRSYMAPPLWPVGPEALPARLRFFPLWDGLVLGPVTVRTLEGVHPGGVTLMRLTAGEKCVVYLPDCTLTDALLPALTAFAADCDLLLCDGQYSDEDWPACRGFGHSTWRMAARLGRSCGAAQVRILHHDPSRTDLALDLAAPSLRDIHPRCHFAREGEEILL